jgi:peptidyl-dipeptidase A
MFFGRRAKSAEFARLLLGLPDERAEEYGTAGRRMLLWERVVFCRWTQVMMRFERALYADPEQDLQRVWWDLVERYQGLRRPSGEGRCDWAAKIHVTTNPVYYHNYMLGEMMASQLQRVLAREVAAVEGPEADWLSFVDVPRAGDKLRNCLLREGARLHWRELVTRVAGEPLSARHFASQLATC